MKDINKGTGSGTNTEYKETKSENKNQEQYRVVISKDANTALESVLTKVNRELEGSSTSKSDIANYVFQNLTKLISESDIKAIRVLHFDEKKVLGTILKNETDLPDELKRAVRDFYGLSEKEKKRSGKLDSGLSTAKIVDKPSAA